MALRLFPAHVTHDGEWIGDIAFEKGVVVEDESKGVGMKAARFGDTDADYILTGHSTTVKVTVVDVTPENLARAIPNAIMDGATVRIKNRLGTPLRQLAKQLVIAKYLDGVPSTAPEDVLTFPLATPMPGRVTHELNGNKQEEFEITFKVWQDEITGELYFYG